MSDIPAPTSLECATLSELVDEIGKRTDCFLFAFTREVRGHPEYIAWSVDYRGDMHTAMGLAVRAKAEMHKKLRERE